jgi:hypothetical protein
MEHPERKLIESIATFDRVDVYRIDELVRMGVDRITALGISIGNSGFIHYEADLAAHDFRMSVQSDNARLEDERAPCFT